MKINNLRLELTREELYNLIENENPTKDVYKNTLLGIINNYQNFSVKQFSWINDKVIFIINKNSKYKSFRKKFNSFEIIGD